MFTKEYIEMASKAKEIQGLWQDRIKNGEYRTDYVYYYDPNNKEYKVDLFLGIHEYGNKISHNLTISPTNSAYGYPGISWQKDINEFKWLPTLEDLWNILHKYYEVCNDSPVRWGKSINKFIMVALYEETISTHDYYLADMKEYLLYFVMRNVYNKSWNKKEWEEINGS